MFSKLSALTKNLWFKATGFAIGLVAVFGAGDYLWKWGTYSFASTFFKVHLLPVLVAPQSLPGYVVIVLVVCAVILIILLSSKLLKREEYFLPIINRFHTGFEPSDYDRRTKWNFKTCNSYYYIPLLVHSYQDVDFREVCGPYCSKCNHILHVDNASDEMGSAFFCVNCRKKYRIPKELLGDYQNKIRAYFSEEFRQHRLRQAE